MVNVVLALSIFLQFVAAVAAIRLISITRRRAGWLAIAAAILLMAIRRSITLTRSLFGDGAVQPDLAAELVALVISALMVAGIVWIGPLFASIRKTNEALKRSTRAWRTLSECNQAILRTRDEKELMQDICRILVEVGGYRLAWVGFAEQDDDQSVRPVAQFGFEEGYLEGLRITWSDTERGRGPTGTVIRTSEPAMARDILTDPQFEPWRESALQRGYASSIALPLSSNGNVFGALNVYAEEPDTFDEEEVRLLQQLAGDLSYSLSALRARKERDKAREAQTRSEQRFQTLFETIREGFALQEIICDGQGKPCDYRFLAVNPAFEEMTGLKARELVGKTVREVLPEIGEDLIRLYGEVAMKGKAVSFETSAYRPGRHYAVDVFSPRKGQFATLFLDITDRVKAREALRESEEKFRIVTEGSLTGVYIIQDDIIQYTNPAMGEIFGYEPEEIMGKLEVSALVHPEDRALVTENLRRRLEGEEDVMRYQLRGLRKDRSIIHCEVLGRRAEYQGKPAVIGTLIDITDRVKAENRIQQQVSQLEALRKIDLAITASLDPRVTFDVLLSQVTEQLGIDAADILVFDRASQTLNLAAGRGFRTDALKHTHLRIGEGNAGKAALDRQIVIIPNLQEEQNELSRAPLLDQEGFVAYFAVPLLAKGTIQGVIEIFHRQPIVPSAEWLGFLEALAGQAAIAIDNAMLFDQLSQSNTDLLRAYDSTIEGWARALELRDMETEGHSQRVTEMTLHLARRLGIDGPELVQIRRGALLHDIGKMGIPDTILHKPGVLSKDEWEIMRKHPVYAYEMLSSVEYLRPALDIPYCHHEKWDGTGYPQGLKGEYIPLPARIFAVVDVWDALRSDRPYRAAWSDEKALAYIREQAGTHFDPKVVDVFLDLLAGMGGSG